MCRHHRRYGSLTQWWANGALVDDESGTADHSYHEELIALHREGS